MNKQKHQQPTKFIYEDPRCPPGAYVQGHRTRDLTFKELVGRGYSEAEARSVVLAQYHTVRDPLTYVIDQVLEDKAQERYPLLPHERNELRARMLKTWQDRLQRKGADWFERYYGKERRVATQRGVLCSDDLEATAR